MQGTPTVYLLNSNSMGISWLDSTGDGYGQLHKALAANGLSQKLMIDASHANSSKKPENQVPVCADIAAQVAGGDDRIIGVMVESHLVAGRQDLMPGKELTYGQSITDGCIDWDSSLQVLDGLADAVRKRRLAKMD